MWKRFLACIRCTTEDPTRAARYRQVKRNRKARAKNQPNKYRSDPDNPLPDVFDTVVVGDPYLVALYNEGLITNHITSHKKSIMRVVENSHRLYRDICKISIDCEHPVLNICFSDPDIEREAESNNFRRQIRRVRGRPPESCEGRLGSQRRRVPVSDLASRMDDPSPTPGTSDRAIEALDPGNAEQAGNSREPEAPEDLDDDNADDDNDERAVAVVGPVNRPRNVIPVFIRAFGDDLMHRLMAPALRLPLPIPEYAHEPPVLPSERRNNRQKKRLRVTKRRVVSPLHWNVRQQIGDPLYPNHEPGPTPAVVFTLDFFRLITFRLSEPGERDRHMRLINIPPAVPNVLPLSAVPFRGAFYNQLRSVLSRARRRRNENTRPERINFRLNVIGLDLIEQRAFLEAQMRAFMAPAVGHAITGN